MSIMRHKTGNINEKRAKEKMKGNERKGRAEKKQGRTFYHSVCLE